MRIRHFLGVSWLFLGRLAALGLLTQALVLPLTGCGGDNSDSPPSTTGPNAGSGSLLIVNPTSGAYQTDRPTVTLGGNSFTPAGAICPAFVGVLPPGYQVTWSNNSTGASGNASRGLNCVLVVFVFWDATNIPLAMGANSITVTAIDGAGNVGRDTIVVTRLPDITPPTVVPVSPVSGATGVGVNTVVTVTFSEAMDQSTISATTVSLEDGVNIPVTAAVTYNSFSLSATLTPSSPLAPNTTYEVTIATGVRDAPGGNVLAVPYTFSFTTL
jgi:Big-like domain-containing protein